jgi:hypothetical protein
MNRFRNMIRPIVASPANKIVNIAKTHSAAHPSTTIAASISSFGLLIAELDTPEPACVIIIFRLELDRMRLNRLPPDA